MRRHSLPGEAAIARAAWQDYSKGLKSYAGTGDWDAEAEAGLALVWLATNRPAMFDGELISEICAERNRVRAQPGYGFVRWGGALLFADCVIFALTRDKGVLPEALRNLGAGRSLANMVALGLAFVAKWLEYNDPLVLDGIESGFTSGRLSARYGIELILRMHGDKDAKVALIRQWSLDPRTKPWAIEEFKSFLATSSHDNPFAPTFERVFTYLLDLTIPLSRESGLPPPRDGPRSITPHGRD